MDIFEAANLPPMDINGLADAYVLVKSKSKVAHTANTTVSHLCTTLHKTELKTKTLSPIWNEKLEKYLPKEHENLRIVFEGKNYNICIILYHNCIIL